MTSIWPTIFFSPAIISYRGTILAAMVSNWMQTIVILLKQCSAGSIMIYIHVNDKWQFKTQQLQDRRIAWKFTELVKHVILISTPNPLSLRAVKISK